MNWCLKLFESGTFGLRALIPNQFARSTLVSRFAETSPSSEAQKHHVLNPVRQLSLRGFQLLIFFELCGFQREAFSLFCALASIPFIACGWSGVLSVAQNECVGLLFFRGMELKMT